MSELHSTRAVIDADAFRKNLESVRSYCGPGPGIMAVVKANAYGHGMVEIAHEAVRSGADSLAVARIDEALELRGEGIDHPLIVFEIARESSLPAAFAAKVGLTVSSRAGAAAISAAASRAGTTAPIHIKVDTGMTRLGFPAAGAVGEILEVLRLPHLRLESVYSHFATSESEEPAFAREQLGRFLDITEALQRSGVDIPSRHMANSGAIIGIPGSHLDMVRPGIMLYGYPPRRGMEEQYPVRPVMSLVSSIALLRSVEPGTSVSYGRRYTTLRPTTIATVPIGYADGYPRTLTNRASALVGGRRYPVVGTICMDHVMLDLGEESGCSEGDKVTLIGVDGGERISAWDIAEATGTIPYEITCRVAARVPRVMQGRSD
jgi:alanine racemase